MREWFLRMAAKLFWDGMHGGKLGGFKRFLIVLLATLASIGRRELVALAGLSVLFGVCLLAVIFVPVAVDAIMTLWIWARVRRGLRSRLYGEPVAVALAGLYVLLVVKDRSFESVLVVWVALLIDSDSFRRWLKKKLGAARATMTSVQQAMFRREVEATR